MIITSTVNANRAELLQRARNFQSNVAADKAFPWQEAVHDESEFYIGMLEKAQDGTLAEIRQRAETQQTESTKKANLAGIGGMVLMAASLFAPLPKSAALLALAGVVGGFFLANFVAPKAAREAAEQQKFVTQLTEWETALAATPSQPQSVVTPQSLVASAPVTVTA